MRVKNRWVRVAGTLLLIELSLQVFTFGRFVWGQVRRRMAEDDIVSRTWALRDPVFASIYQEESDIRLSYEPFTGWRMEELHTPHINVDEHGVRQTVGNPEGNRADIPRIFLFGGSAMWGEGLSDEHTIPSLIAREVNATEPFTEITNYGQLGYSLRQEVIKLATLLASGSIPDYVVFYDGCNDFFLNTLDTVPHRTFRDTRMREVLGDIWSLPEDGKDPVTVANTSVFSPAFWKKLARGAATYIQVIHYPVALYERVAVGTGIREKVKSMPVASQKERDAVVATMIDSYIGSVQILDALSKHYGFDYMLVWQPTVYSKKLTEEEQRLPDISAETYGDLSSVYVSVADKLSRAGLRQFIDLSGSFEGTTGNVFTDTCHITPDANTIIAAHIRGAIKDYWYIR